MKTALETIYGEIFPSSVDTYPFALRIREVIEGYAHGLEIGADYKFEELDEGFHVKGRLIAFDEEGDSFIVWDDEELPQYGNLKLLPSNEYRVVHKYKNRKASK